MSKDCVGVETRISGEPCPASGQPLPPVKDPRPELGAAEVVAMLRPAIDLEGADPQCKLQALAAARASSQSTYEALLQTSDADLSADMQEVIRLYQAAGDQMDQLQMKCVDAALDDYTSLFDAIMKIPSANRTEQMGRFLALFLQIAQQSRQISTTLSVLGFRTQIEELKSVAQKIKDEGDKAFDAGMVRGALSVTAGATVGVLGGVSSYKQVRSAQYAETAERLGPERITKEQEIATTRAEIAALQPHVPAHHLPLGLARHTLDQQLTQLTGIQGRINSAVRASTQYNHSANDWMTTGRAFEPVLSSSGSMTASKYEQESSQERSEQTAHQAASAAGEQNKSLAEKFAESSQAVVASVLQTVRDVGQAEAEALKAAAQA